MSERLKNGKLIGCFVLLMVLCVGLLIKGKTGKMLEPDATPIQKEPLVLSNVWLMESGEKSITVLCDGCRSLCQSLFPDALWILW